MEERSESPFDPAAFGAKLFGEIQAEGLRAAGALVERLVHLVDGPRVTAEGEPAGDPTGIDMGAVTPWFELWGDLLERTTDALQRSRATGSPGVDIGGGLAPARPLGIALDAGATGKAEMWLHNGTTQTHGELVPQCGPLSDEHGYLLDCEIDIAPPKVDQLAGHSSRGFAVSVTTGPAASPGTYRGIVQVRGAGSVWMPIEVVVKAPSP